MQLHAFTSIIFIWFAHPFKLHALSTKPFSLITKAFKLKPTTLSNSKQPVLYACTLAFIKLGNTFAKKLKKPIHCPRQSVVNFESALSFTV